jgi:cell wall-associated NlpC family hydrolase
MKKEIFYCALAAGLFMSSCSQNSQPKEETTVEPAPTEEKTTRTNSRSSYSLSQEELAKLTLTFGFSIYSTDNTLLYSKVYDWLGTPYLYGGTDKSGADCSGFICSIYREIYGKRLERQTCKIFSENCERIDKEELKEGDLVFFNTNGNTNADPNYAGIYLKNGKFVSMSSSKGVIISNLSSNYYTRNWVAGGRVTID